MLINVKMPIFAILTLISRMNLCSAEFSMKKFYNPGPGLDLLYHDNFHDKVGKGGIKLVITRFKGALTITRFKGALTICKHCKQIYER